MIHGNRFAGEACNLLITGKSCNPEPQYKGGRGSDRMNRIIDVAQYVFEEYKKVTGEVIDEMKLQFL